MLHSTKGVPATKPTPINHTCPNCTRTKIALFYSTVCTWCDEPPKGVFYVGHVLWDKATQCQMDRGDTCCLYVWHTESDAKQYLANLTADLAEWEIRTVLSASPFQWKYGYGAAENLLMASQAVMVYKDHRYAPAPFRAFLAPQGTPTNLDRVRL